MNTDDVINILSSISIGTIISWIMVIASIIGSIGFLCIKVYKAFEKSQQIKDENDLFKNMVKDHDTQLKTIIEKLDNISLSMEEHNRLNLKNLRHSIVRAGEEAISDGEISIRKLKSLEEMYDEYSNKYHANGYVKTLMNKVRQLEVIGALDENDEDIE